MAASSIELGNKKRACSLFAAVQEAKRTKFPLLSDDFIEKEVESTVATMPGLDDSVIVRVAVQQLEYHSLKQEQMKRDKAIMKQNDELRKLDEEQMKLDDENHHLKQEIMKRDKELLTHTIAGALSLTATDSIKCKLCLRGNKGSHTYQMDEKATIVRREFPLKPIANAASFKGSSALMGAISRADWTYANEHDVQMFVHCALVDAVEICKTLLKNDETTTVELSVRHEARLDSNYLDHSVVYDLVSMVPVFEIETKNPLEQPLGEPENIEKVIGQVFNQLSAMNAFGHPNPFAALTTFDETRIVWIDTGTADSVLHAYTEQGMATDWTKTISSDLSTDHQKLTRSPIKVEAPPEQSSMPAFPKLAEFRNVERKLQMSNKPLAVHEMIPALVNAILCSLVGFHKAKAPILKLTKGFRLEQPVIRLTINQHSVGRGSGSTSRAYRAVDLNGRECVLKIYTRKYDEENKEWLTREEFEKNAKEAVNSEVQNYHKVYPELTEHVFPCQLVNQLHCVVHPFFENIEPKTLGDIQEAAHKVGCHLKEKYASQKLGFLDRDIAWRHIGEFNGQLYLFNLAHLCTIDDFGKYVEHHKACLLLDP